jgi:hypothetical protein
MKMERITMVCDVCSSTATFDTDVPVVWADVTIVHAGELHRRDVCPNCVARLLDPPEDLAAELHRFARM